MPPAEPQLLRTRAELSLARWRARDALGAFSSIPDALQQPEILERLALCAELLGDYETADAHFERAQRLEPLEHPAPPRLDPEEFDAVVQEGVNQLPPELAVALERVAVVIDPMPTHELCGDDPVETPPELLGLFVGPSLLDQSIESSGELPPTVYLFQRNLERVCDGREQLVEEIRVTLFHELGHALGFDEEGVARMGLE